MKKNIKIISALLLIILLLTVFCGCSAVSKDKAADEISKAWNEAGTEFPQGSFMSVFDEESTFTVVEVTKVEKDYYRAACNVISPNILEDMKKYQQNEGTDATPEEMNSAIIEMIKNGKPTATVQTVDIFKTDKGYSVVFSEGFVDAMYGYTYSYYKEQLNNMITDSVQ